MAGAGSYKNKTLPLRERNEENSTQSRGVVAVPVVVKPVVVPVPPAFVKVKVTDVQVGIRVAVACRAPSVPPPFEYSLGCIVFVSYTHLALYTKYLLFLKFLHTPLYLKPWSEIISMYGYWIR